jgi:glycosyltransferase involved in cell wall biosynthesis
MHTPQRPRLLALGESQRRTGYARVAAEALPALGREFEVHQYELFDNGGRVERPWRVHRRQFDGDPYGLKSLPELIGRIRPDVALVIHNPTTCRILKEVLRQAGLPTLAYLPIEGPELPGPAAAAVGWVERIVVCNSFGWGLLPPELQGKAVVIPHGVSAGRFFPLGSRAAARRRLFPDRPEVWDGWIVLNANRNTGRKRVDLSVEGFARFARGRTDVWLYLHMGRRDQGCDILELARRNGVEDRLLMTHDRDHHPDVPDEQLNLIYNACDVGLNTSAGEGWGLVALEHAATRAAQIVAGHGSAIELWGEAACLLTTHPAAGWACRKFTPMTVRPADVAAALATLHEQPELRDRMAAAAYRRALASDLDPGVIGTSWRWAVRAVL